MTKLRLYARLCTQHLVLPNLEYSRLSSHEAGSAMTLPYVSQAYERFTEGHWRPPSNIGIHS